MTRAYRTQQPENTGVIGNLYTFEGEEGQKRYDVEEMLSRLESHAAPGIVRLARREKLTDEQRANVLLFIAFARNRTPEWMETVKTLTGDLTKWVATRMFAEVDHVREILRKDNGHLPEEEQFAHANRLAEFAQSDRYTVKVNDRAALGLALSTAPAIAETLKTRNWTVLHPQRARDSFVTSDAPVILVSRTTHPSYGVGFANLDAVVYFPLGQDACLILHGEGMVLDHLDISQNMVVDINRAVAASCQRYVIGRDHALVKSLVKHTRIDKTIWKPSYNFS